MKIKLGYNFEWMKVYFSPFKPIIPRLYIGKTKIGTPVFYPRKWVKATPERANKAVLDYFEREKNYNKMNPDYARKIKPYDEVFKEKMRYSYAVDKKVGFDFVGLIWKTKWTPTDYIFEYQPVWSLVFFGYQIALIFNVPEPYHYWTCWLYYNRNTDKNKTTKERLVQAKEGFPCKWRNYSNGEEKLFCYWDVIIKNKYIN